MNCTARCGVDFWSTASPAVGYAGEYSARVYSDATVGVVESAAASADPKPFFVYLAYANTHEPLEAPVNHFIVSLATENLLENSDMCSEKHNCSLWTAACYLVVVLTCALLMTSSYAKVAEL